MNEEKLGEKIVKVEKRLNHIETDIGWIKKILWAIVIPVWILVVAGVINLVLK